MHISLPTVGKVGCADPILYKLPSLYFLRGSSNKRHAFGHLFLRL